MISVEKARELILKNTRVLGSANVSIANSLGNVLHTNVVSPVYLPPFNQSSMDGYVIKFSDFTQNKL